MKHIAYASLLIIGLSSAALAQAAPPQDPRSAIYSQLLGEANARVVESAAQIQQLQSQITELQKQLTAAKAPPAATDAPAK